MATVQKSLRIPKRTASEVERLGAESGLDFSGAANQLLQEAIRMRRCPGIAFTSGPSGRRATVAGTGLDVWEIIASHRSVGGDLRKLRKAYHWLTEPQLRAALAYYELYGDEIDARVARDQSWTASTLRSRHPGLVRCEVDLDHDTIRFFALRRRQPDHQPLLAELPYRLPRRRFKE